MRRLTSFALAGLLVVVPASLQGKTPAALPAEAPGVAALPADDAHRVYVNDLAPTRIVDTKISVVDGDSFRYLGSIPSGFLGAFDFVGGKPLLVVATSYYSRGSRGKRTDVLEMWDTRTLQNIGEIEIPKKRASGSPIKGVLRTSADGRWAFVQNSTPAASVTVVDLAARKFAAEIENSGCFGVIPSTTNPERFISPCGDGSLLVTDIDGAGGLKAQSSIPGFFVPDDDPMFVHSEVVGDRHYFLTYRGRVLTVDLSGARPAVERSWSLLDPADEQQGWRPGGSQLMAIHPASGRLFVSMHPGGFNGSHKEPAKEVWVFDLAKRQRIARLDGHNAAAIGVTQDAAPKLYLSDPVNRGLIAYDAQSLTPAGSQPGLFDFGFNMLTR